MENYTILGGGIAGLACAIQLTRAGKNVQIFEKNSYNHSKGHAFILMPNGLKALKHLGVQEKVLKTAHAVNQFQLHDPEGGLSAFEKLSGAVGIKRESLINILTDALPKGIIQYEKGFSHFNTDATGHIEEAVFVDGSRCEGDVFIGADGIWSKTRQTVQANFSLSPVRIREIVSVIKAPDLVKEYRGSFVKVIREKGGLAVGMVPCDEEHLVWFVQYDSHHHDLLETTLAEQKDRLFQLIRTWCHPIPELLAKTDFLESYVWHTTDMNPIPTYNNKNLALIGDAAHVLLTLTSQGVSSALEDAIVLTDLIKRYPSENIMEIFNRYSTARKDIMEQYFQFGRTLKEEFLHPGLASKKRKIPLVYSEM